MTITLTIISVITFAAISYRLFSDNSEVSKSINYLIKKGENSITHSPVNENLIIPEGNTIAPLTTNSSLILPGEIMPPNIDNLYNNTVVPLFSEHGEILIECGEIIFPLTSGLIEGSLIAYAPFIPILNTLAATIFNPWFNDLLPASFIENYFINNRNMFSIKHQWFKDLVYIYKDMTGIYREIGLSIVELYNYDNFRFLKTIPGLSERFSIFNYKNLNVIFKLPAMGQDICKVMGSNSGAFLKMFSQSPYLRIEEIKIVVPALSSSLDQIIRPTFILKEIGEIIKNSMLTSYLNHDIIYIYNAIKEIHALYPRAPGNPFVNESHVINLIYLMQTFLNIHEGLRYMVVIEDLNLVIKFMEEVGKPPHPSVMKLLRLLLCNSNLNPENRFVAEFETLLLYFLKLIELRKLGIMDGPLYDNFVTSKIDIIKLIRLLLVLSEAYAEAGFKETPKVKALREMSFHFIDPSSESK